MSRSAVECEQQAFTCAMASPTLERDRGRREPRRFAKAMEEAWER